MSNIEENPRVFIHYTTENANNFVVNFVTKLRRRGIDAWMRDWELSLGDNEIGKSFEALKNTQAIIIIFLPESTTSRWTDELIDYALFRKINNDVNIIPVVVSGSLVPESISSLRSVYIKDTENFNKEIDAILLHLSKETNKPLSGSIKRSLLKLKDSGEILEILIKQRENIINYMKNMQNLGIEYDKMNWNGKYTPLHGGYINAIYAQYLSLEDEGLQKKQLVPLIDIIRQNKKIIITGYGGFGKTTTLFEYLRLSSIEILNSKSIKTLPVYVSLSQLTVNSNIESLILSSFSRSGINIGIQDLQDLLAEGLLEILLDGLNEIDFTIRHIYERDILSFIQRYPENKFILTSRPYDFYNDLMKDMRMVVVHPMDNSSIIRFAENCMEYRSCNEFLMKSGIIGDNSSVNNDIIGVLRNPLFLWMSIQIYKSTGEFHLFKGEIFKNFVSLTFGLIERSKPNKYQGIIKENLLKNIAFYMFKDGYIIHIDKNYLLRMKDLITHDTTDNEYLDMINETTQNGFLRMLPSGNYEWTHQRYQEYFAATKLSEIFSQRNNISRLLNDYRWKDIIILTADIIGEPEKFISEILYGWRGIIGIIEHRNPRIMLAVHTMYSARNRLSENFKKKIIRSVQKKMFTNIPRQSVFTLEKFVGLGGPLTSYLGQALLTNKHVKIRAIGIWLIGISKDKKNAYKIIPYLEDRSRIIRWIVAYSLRFLKPVEAVHLLIQRLGESDLDVKWISMRALAAIGDKRAIAPLIIMLQDPSSDIRAGAAYGLWDLKAKESLPALQEALQNPLNNEILWWGESVNDVIEKTITYIIQQPGDRPPKRPDFVW